MKPAICNRCKKNVAVLFITKVENGKTTNEGLCLKCAKDLGLPEAALPLASAVITLATAPKSNSAYQAYAAAREDVQMGMGSEVPTHLQSPLFKGYKYPHDYPNHFVEQTYLPNDLKGKQYYSFGFNKTEQAAKAYYDMIRKKRP